MNRKQRATAWWQALDWSLPNERLAEATGYSRNTIAARRRWIQEGCPEHVYTVTPKKAAQLKRVHDSRRGKPVNDPGIRPAQLRKLLAQVQGIIRENDGTPSERSTPSLAKEIGCTVRSIRRWLQGTRTPPSTAVVAMQAWLRKVDQ